MVKLIELLPQDWWEALSYVESKIKIEEKLNDIESKLSNLQEDIIFPRKENIFKAFKATPFENVKAVILGQDPYHKEGIADGLAFSVGNESRPSSLRNIFKEMVREKVMVEIPAGNWNLENWAKQGVLLLNTILTVEKGKAKSHKYIGWEYFSDLVLKAIATRKKNIVFFLWGKDAHRKENEINTGDHLILKNSHPSGLSVNIDFNKGDQFLRAKDYLKRKYNIEIDWNL